MKRSSDALNGRTRVQRLCAIKSCTLVLRLTRGRGASPDVLEGRLGTTLHPTAGSAPQENRAKASHTLTPSPPAPLHACKYSMPSSQLTQILFLLG